MDNQNKKISIEITSNTILKVLFILAILVLVYLIREIIVILFFAFILVSILEPMVDWLKGKKISKVLSVLLIYLVLISFLVLIVILLIPLISDQTAQLQMNFPVYWNKIIDDLNNISQLLSSYGLSAPLKTYLSSFSSAALFTGDIFETIGDFFRNIFDGFVILVITFYLLVEENAAKKILRSIMPVDVLPYSYQMFNRIQRQLGLWLRGQLILSFCIFILVFLALSALGVKYALILGIIAGILEFIPYLGPAFSGFIAVTLTLLHSPIQALMVLIFYILIQVFENNVLVPNVMRHAVGLNPVISIVSLLIGATLGGFIGVILAIPVATSANVFLQDILDQKRAKEINIE
jgi:predicted PurR-regulated permease PerM